MRKSHRGKNKSNLWYLKPEVVQHLMLTISSILIYICEMLEWLFFFFSEKEVCATFSRKEQWWSIPHYCVSAVVSLGQHDINGLPYMLRVNTHSKRWRNKRLYTRRSTEPPAELWCSFLCTSSNFSLPSFQEAGRASAERMPQCWNTLGGLSFSHSLGGTSVHPQREQ